MTYNQVVIEIKRIMEENAILNSVRFATPLDWLNYGGNPELPIGLFTISTGSYDRSYQNTYAVKFWLLDKSGPDNEFETEVISDMASIGRDVINALTLSSNNYSVSLPVQWTAISEKFEDYLSGVTFTAIMQTTGQFTYCDYPTTN